MRDPSLGVELERSKMTPNTASSNNNSANGKRNSKQPRGFYMTEKVGSPTLNLCGSNLNLVSTLFDLTQSYLEK